MKSGCRVRGEVDVTSMFLTEIRPIPMLTRDEEVKFFTEFNIVKGVDTIRENQIRDHIVKSNMRLVISIAKKYSSKGVDLIDLMQEGAMGLQSAVDRFDIERGWKFGTYATFWIFKKVTQALHQQTGLFYVPHEAKKKLNCFKAAYNAFVLTNDASYVDLLDGLLKKEDVKKTEELYRITQRPHSLHDMVKDKNSTFENVLLDDSEHTMEDTLGIKHDITQMLERLGKDERAVIETSFGILSGYEVTNVQVSKLLNINSTKVSVLRKSALQKLKTMLECSVYEDEYSDEFKDYEDV